MSRNIVIGAITGYAFEKVRPWIVSAKRACPTAEIMLFCWAIDERTIETIEKYGVRCLRVQPPPATGQNIVVERFGWLSQFVENEGLTDSDWIVTTDVADVVFQYDPFSMLHTAIGQCDILASSEGISYKDEPWGSQNIRLSYSETSFNMLADQRTLNAGVIAGRAKAVGRLAWLVYIMSHATKYGHHIPGGGGPDQAAYNLLIRNAVGSRARILGHEMPWAAQLGTTGPQVDPSWSVHVCEPKPMIDNGVVKTHCGGIYAIVHQYNRVPEWKNIIEELYSGS